MVHKDIEALDQVGSLSVLVLIKLGFSDPVTVERMSVDMRTRGRKGAATEFRERGSCSRDSPRFSPKSEERGGGLIKNI